MPTSHFCPQPCLPTEPCMPSREELEERLAFGDAKLKVGRMLLNLMDEQHEQGHLTENDTVLLYKAIDAVLYSPATL